MVGRFNMHLLHSETKRGIFFGWISETLCGFAIAQLQKTTIDHTKLSLHKSEQTYPVLLNERRFHYELIRSKRTARIWPRIKKKKRWWLNIQLTEVSLSKQTNPVQGCWVILFRDKEVNLMEDITIRQWETNPIKGEALLGKGHQFITNISKKGSSHFGAI